MKFSVLGDKGVGKTSFISYFINEDEKTYTFKTTLGDINIEFIDNSLEDDIDGCIVLFDLTIKGSDKGALKIIESLPENIPVVVAGTKIGTADCTGTLSSLDKRVRDYGYYAICSKVGFNMTKPLLMICKKILFDF